MKQENKDTAIGCFLIVLYVIAGIALAEFGEWLAFRHSPLFWGH